MIYPSPAWPLCAHPHVIRLHSCRVLPLVSAARVRPGPPAGRPVRSLRKRTEHRPKREQLAATISHFSSGTRLVTLWITTSSMAPFSELTSSINEFSPRGERGERADRLHSVTFRDGGKTFTETATTGYSDLQVATINCRGRCCGPTCVKEKKIGEAGRHSRSGPMCRRRRGSPSQLTRNAAVSLAALPGLQDPEYGLGAASQKRGHSLCFPGGETGKSQRRRNWQIGGERCG